MGDFGLAIQQRQELPFLRAGTLDYMSPEVRLASVQHKVWSSSPSTLPRCCATGGRGAGPVGIMLSLGTRPARCCHHQQHAMYLALLQVLRNPVSEELDECSNLTAAELRRHGFEPYNQQVGGCVGAASGQGVTQ